MAVRSLTSALNRALNGIDRSIADMDRVAATVARGVRGTNDDFARALARMPEIRQHVRANVAVIRAADDLYRELVALHRR
jgi:hypothetical protein